MEYKTGGDFILTVKWAFIELKLLPAKKKEKKPKKPKPPQEEKPKEEKPAEEKPKEKKDNPVKIFYENEKLAGFADLAQRFFNLLYKFGLRMGRCFIFDEAFLDLGITGSDSAETAEKYGKYCRMVFPAFGALCANCKVNDYNVNVYPDFIALPGNRIEMIFTFAVIPRKMINTVVMFGAGVVFKVGLRFLKGLKKRSPAPAAKNSGNAEIPDMTPEQPSVQKDNI